MADQAGLDRVVALCFLVQASDSSTLAESLVDERLVLEHRCHLAEVAWPDPLRLPAAFCSSHSRSSASFARSQ